MGGAGSAETSKAGKDFEGAALAYILAGAAPPF
jgi:hypothetical protein